MRTRGDDYVQIAMVGYGRIAGMHSRALASLSGVKLHTVVGVRPEPMERFAREHGYARTSLSLEEALADPSVDAVLVCSPSPLHATQTELALRAGKHVLCEIPLALSVGEAERLGALARERDLRLMVCHTERFEPGKVELRRRIATGALHPQQVVARFHMLRRGLVDTGPERRGWVDNTLWHHGCHTVDAVLDLLGEPETVGLAAAFGPPWPGLDSPIDVALQWRTPRGVVVSVSLSHNAAWGVHDYRLICQEDTLVCDHGALETPRGTVLQPAMRYGAIVRQDQEFVMAVREGRESAVSVASILPTMRVLQAAWDMRTP